MRIRRKSVQMLIAIVGVVIVAALAGSQVAFPDQKSKSSSGAALTGSWNVRIVGGPGTPPLPSWYQADVTFDRDGGLVATITDPSINTGHGAWTKVGNRKFAVTIFLFQFEQSGKFAGTLRARATLKLDKKSRTFDSDDYRFDFFDPDGNPTGFAGVGQAHGTRIAVQR
jgi:hypothetical protein